MTVICLVELFGVRDSPVSCYQSLLISIREVLGENILYSEGSFLSSVHSILSVVDSTHSVFGFSRMCRFQK